MAVGSPVKEKKKMCDILVAFVLRRSYSLHGASVIGAYHARRVASLMAHALPLFKMVPVMKLGGTVLSQVPLRNNEIA